MQCFKGRSPYTMLVRIQLKHEDTCGKMEYCDSNGFEFT